MNIAIIITTINGPEHGSMPDWRKLVDGRSDMSLIVVGDAKTPDAQWREIALKERQLVYLGLDEQEHRWPVLAKMIKTGTYARKNFGYLLAAQLGFDGFFETDDDNWPLAHTATALTRHKQCYQENASTHALVPMSQDTPWVNHWMALRRISTPPMWPRGGLVGYLGFALEPADRMESPIVHFACDGDPDRDAIGRLRDPDARATFVDYTIQYQLARNAWAPFNTQSTLFSLRHGIEIARLAYVPWTCPHRVTDILRGWVARPAVQSMNMSIGFAGRMVRQERNPHDLLADFNEELSLYALAPTIPFRLSADPEISYQVCCKKLSTADGSPLCTAADVSAFQVFTQEMSRCLQ